MRTECFAMSVELWSADEICGEIAKFMLRPYEAFLVEYYVSEMARKVCANNCAAAREWEEKFIRFSPRPVFVTWELLSESRKIAISSHLWHETATPEQYAELGRKLGRGYPLSVFAALKGFVSQGGA
jgi:hypothetical protein